MTDPFGSKVVARETHHTVALLEPHLADASSILDVGCGDGLVAWSLARRFRGEVATVDIGDFRRVPTPGFHVYDGVHLPFPDGRFDVVNVAFVLHHVPDVVKPLLLSEIRRVARRKIVILEDTPATWIDRAFAWWHGTTYRRKIRSRARFGFLRRDEWERLFPLLGLEPLQVQSLSRFCRARTQPFARTLFVLQSVRHGAPRA
jgi:ubiquinone/menaquinone biosynthesis C-methylase UbiE